MKQLKYIDRCKALFEIKMAGSSIVETLVASVIIVLIFSIASLTLNNIFRTNILSDTLGIENHSNKLIYLYKNQRISTPFYDNYKGWELSLSLDNKEIVVIAKKKIGENFKSFKKSVRHDID